jgi:hypothetical protein
MKKFTSLALVALIALSLQACGRSAQQISISEPVHIFSYEADRTKLAICSLKHYQSAANEVLLSGSPTAYVSPSSGKSVMAGHVQHKYWRIFAPSRKMVWEAILQDGTVEIRDAGCIGCGWTDLIKQAIETCNLELGPAGE